MECLEYEVRGRQTIAMGRAEVCADVITTVSASSEAEALQIAHRLKNISSASAKPLGASVKPIGTISPIKYASREAEERFKSQLNLVSALY